MNTVNAITTELVKKVESMIEDVRNGYPSQYYTFTINEDTDDEDTVTIRVADHMANPARVSGRTIFFIVENKNEKVINKQFTSIAGRIYLNDDNCDENGYDIESLLDSELN